MVSLISPLNPCIAESLAGSSCLQLFPELSSWSALHLQDAAHTPLRYRSRAAGAALCAHTPMHTECPGWNKGVSSNPCRGIEVSMAATFLGVNGWPASESARSAPAQAAVSPLHPAKVLFISVAALGFSSFHPTPRNQGGLSAHASLKPSTDTCTQLVSCSCQLKYPYNH